VTMLADPLPRVDWDHEVQELIKLLVEAVLALPDTEKRPVIIESVALSSANRDRGFARAMPSNHPLCYRRVRHLSSRSLSIRSRPGVPRQNHAPTNYSDASALSRLAVKSNAMLQARPTPRGYQHDNCCSAR
jgi:hypothetical protein